MDIPNRIFDRQIGEISLREIFEKDEYGNYINFDSTEDRETCKKKYRIPIHQRFNKWNIEAKETTIESIFYNYIIGSISLSQHVDTNNSDFYWNIEDGQSRLSIIQEYLEDKFPYKEKSFSELNDTQKNRFLDYKFPKEMTTISRTRGDTITIKDHYYENFDRINRGKALTDNDKYWCRKEKPMVKFSINLINKFNSDDTYNFMNTGNFGKIKDDKVNRDVLEKIITIVGAILYGVYKKSFTRHREHYGNIITPDKKQMVYKFFDFYRSIHDGMLLKKPKKRQENYITKNFNNPGKFLSMVIMDFMNERQNENGDIISDRIKANMWMDIINIDRESENFMMGKKTLWMKDFTDGDRKNQEKLNISKRLDRVICFYDNKTIASERYLIEYKE